MSVLGIGATAGTTAPSAIGVQPQQAVLAMGGGVPGQMALPGAAMAQPGGVGSLLKKAIIGGVAGGAIGVGLHFIPWKIFGVTFAKVAIPKLALFGAVAGVGLLVAVGIIHAVRSRNLGLKAQQQVPQALMAAPTSQIPVGAGMAPTSMVPAPLKGRTWKVGTRPNGDVRFTQKALKQVGLYNGKATGKLDRPTAAAIRKYEILKGALPTGRSTPDLRASLYQDMRLAHQFG